MAQVSFGEEMHKAGTIVEVFIINSSHQPASDCGGQVSSPFCALAKCITLDCSRDQSNVRDGATQSLDYYSGAVNYGSSGNILNYIILADCASVSDRESGKGTLSAFTEGRGRGRSPIHTRRNSSCLLLEHGIDWIYEIGAYVVLMDAHSCNACVIPLIRKKLKH